MFVLVLGLQLSVAAKAEMDMDHDHDDHKMTLDDEGMVMNWNNSQLPTDCSSISKEYVFTVKAGVKYAEAFEGTVFGFDLHEFKVEPCSKVTIHFVNEDKVRHQWMMHGLPKYIYQQGMFHLEAAGGATKSGTFIVPSDDKTYLVHCDIAQHMENGMKSQLVVGKGNGSFASVPGLTASIWP
ncbi:MAG: multicopper oxidase domain-containing protein, partial [Gammaproteobacteria bacterium]|nr:multicopper oxidase domain-containing protein [Gammaproteobacteria bacterium]